MEINVASDHAGVYFKSRVLQYLAEKKINAVDLGTNADASVDYPDYGMKVAKLVSEGKVEQGILVCGTGVGMSIVANKFSGVRAALCHNKETAEASRRHNDANILVLGSRVLDVELGLTIVETWLATPFEGGRHQRRLDKITEIEKTLKNAPEIPADTIE